MNWDALKADTHRLHGSFSWTLVMRGALTCRPFRMIVSLRLCQALAETTGLLRLLLVPVKLLHILATHLAGADLSWKTQIGSGLAIHHGWGLVVNPHATIGRNVTLFHGVTLGRRDRISPTGERLTAFPVIEDQVWIGPHAIIVGGITVGRGSRIGGGAYVTEDVPPFSVVIGNPASIVKSGCVPDVFNPAPCPDSEPDR